MGKTSNKTRMSRGEADRAFGNVGRATAESLGSGRALRPFTGSKKRKPEVLESFVEPSSKKLRKNAEINRRFRAAWSGQDELFSTASLREFVKGAIGNQKRTDFTDDEWDELVELVDLISDLRIPTEYSGFSLSGGSMQHPANRSAAFFEDPYRTASAHSELDQERRIYIIRALQEAVDNDEEAAEIVEAGARAAVEFTLNYFTAPVTAANVQPFSRRAGTQVNNPENIDQVAARERLKRGYTELGGKIPTTTESLAQRLVRPWAGAPAGNSYPEAPPSPRRLPDDPAVPLNASGW
jgi:hypothetical protein